MRNQSCSEFLHRNKAPPNTLVKWKEGLECIHKIQYYNTVVLNLWFMSKTSFYFLLYLFIFIFKYLDSVL